MLAFLHRLEPPSFQLTAEHAKQLLQRPVTSGFSVMLHGVEHHFGQLRSSA